MTFALHFDHSRQFQLHFCHIFFVQISEFHSQRRKTKRLPMCRWQQQSEPISGRKLYIKMSKYLVLIINFYLLLFQWYFCFKNSQSIHIRILRLSFYTIRTQIIIIAIEYYKYHYNCNHCIYLIHILGRYLKMAIFIRILKHQCGCFLKNAEIIH